MLGGADLIVRVSAGADDDQEETASFARRLRSELLDLDVLAEPVSEATAPDGAKGLSQLVGTLAVSLGTQTVKAIVARIRDWVSRNGRVVEVTIDGDTIKINRPTAGQQDQIVNAWLARHAPEA